MLPKTNSSEVHTPPLVYHYSLCFILEIPVSKQKPNMSTGMNAERQYINIGPTLPYSPESTVIQTLPILTEDAVMHSRIVIVNIINRHTQRECKD